MYRQQRLAGESKNDFLQFFKNAESLAWNGYKEENGTGRVDVSKVRVLKCMTPSVGFSSKPTPIQRLQEIEAQCRFISIAGFDTTANTLALCCWMLANKENVLVSTDFLVICSTLFYEVLEKIGTLFVYLF